jgi:hypothetical protein
MKSRTLEIVFAPSGELQIDAVGFRGADCEQATAFLEEALGKVTAKRRKSDWYQQSRRTSQQRVGS